MQLNTAWTLSLQNWEFRDNPQIWLKKQKTVACAILVYRLSPIRKHSNSNNNNNVNFNVAFILDKKTKQ